MSLFEFVTVIISMILALAMGRLLMGISEIVEKRRNAVGSATHSIWLVSLFLLILHTWWTQWDFREIEWTYPAFVYVGLSPTILFFAVELIIPSHVGERPLDVREHFRNVRPFMLVMVAENLFLWLDGPVLMGQHALGRIGLLHLFFVAFLLLGLSTEREGPNRIAALGVLAVLLVAASLRFSRAPSPNDRASDVSAALRSAQISEDVREPSRPHATHQGPVSRAVISAH